MNKSSNILFMNIMLMSVMLSISSNSWFIVWMGMEINMMAFLPMIMEQKNMNSKEAALTYFLVQTIASMMMLMSIIIMMIDKNNMNMITSNMKDSLMMSALMMKSGISPFHFWMPKTMEGLNWNKCLILMTIQKITPLMMMSYIIKMSLINISVMILSVYIGAIGGLNQTSLRKLMAYSSISNNGWMMMAMMMSENMWLIYFMIYTMMTMMMALSMNNYKLFNINQLMSMNESTYMKMLMMINMLSISGLPPMMGFLPKWMVIQTSMNTYELMLMMVMVMLTLITIYYYLRMLYSAMLMTNTNHKWHNMMKKNENKDFMPLTVITTMGLMLITMMMSLY
uniref:NADH-ubiquinone oxidoreductase chain 2 n=1 Tax=Megacrania alpheus adan TaxID=590997 RepID=E2RV48_9NEOP|nr:NADH dehydrogenase subunit 2 [Megacrania alpheus adan]BAJ24582.1 NADH dehydrogenase subunit 2 [Megacrania alpheus adan]